jgi:putative hydrolase of the HAD superfamily
MTPPAAIFFDMDGTLLDWQSGMEESWLASCEAHCDGSSTPNELHDAIRERRTWFWSDAGRSRTGRLDLDAACRRIVEHAFADMGLVDVPRAHRLADDYRARRDACIAPYAGAIELLEALRTRGTALALITNGGAASQRRSIERFGLAQFFECIVVEGEFGCGKPDQRVFLHALAACGADARSTWMVGDSLEADIAPALALGMHAVWIDASDSGVPRAEPRPHRIISTIAELA